ncbi:MAG: hypothetical protein KGJ02_07865, partial [Verrucomicrobiota bacterium]|nr:hypothetical protein [Verrucomicrobiota bacterium]
MTYCLTIHRYNNFLQDHAKFVMHCKYITLQSKDKTIDESYETLIRRIWVVSFKREEWKQDVKARAAFQSLVRKIHLLSSDTDPAENCCWTEV